LFELFFSNYVPQGGTANYSELADAADRFPLYFFFVIELFELFELFFQIMFRKAERRILANWLTRLPAFRFILFLSSN